MGYYTDGGRGDENSRRPDTYHHNKSSGGEQKSEGGLCGVIVVGFLIVIGLIGYGISQVIA